MPRPRGFPFFRIGLTIVAGSVLASLLYFYIGVGQQMADMQGETVSTKPRDLAGHFLKNFLFAGATPGILFYIGLAIMILGVFRSFTRPTHPHD